MSFFHLAVLLLLSCLHRTFAWQVGTAISDITGPIVDVPAMGFPGIELSGLHTRLYSRAFVFKDSRGGVFAYVVADMAMISTLVKQEVLQQLNSNVTGNIFHAGTVMITATHTHAGAGGYNSDMLYLLGCKGLFNQVVNALVSGIVDSIKRAYFSLQKTRLYLNTGEIDESLVSVNRHPMQYELNPELEKLRFKNNKDTNMQLLKIVGYYNKEPLGAIVWFPVHGTSLKQNNVYISGDNKGIASQLLERHLDTHHLPGDSQFVAAFPQSNAGDISPNTGGVVNITTGEPCNMTQEMNTYECTTKGPGKDILDSAYIVGRIQFFKSLELFESATEEIADSYIEFVHEFIDFSNYTFKDGLGVEKKTCTAALGYPFAAGSIDGHGMLTYFRQGIRQNNPLVNKVRDFLGKVSEEDKRCHGNKNILVNIGKMSWSGNIFAENSLPLHVAKLGPLVILGLPAEITTMAGRHMKEQIAQVLNSSNKHEIVIGSLTNAYSLYVTTEAEYNGTYYEGAANLFGPNTLDAYIDKFKKMLPKLSVVSAQEVDQFYPQQTKRFKELRSQTSDVLLMPDFPGIFNNFGDVVLAPKSSYLVGESVTVEFISSDPRHSLGKQLHSYLYIERLDHRGRWFVVCSDSCYETTMQWKRLAFFNSKSKVIWQIPPDQQPGTYRIRYLGHIRDNGDNAILPSYQGVTESFQVVSVGQKSVDWKQGPEIPLSSLLHSNLFKIHNDPISTSFKNPPSVELAMGPQFSVNNGSPVPCVSVSVTLSLLLLSVAARCLVTVSLS